MLATADLCDRYQESLQVVQFGLRKYGLKAAFSGPIKTIQTYEDNTKVANVLETGGKGQVLVVDGAGSLHCALLGDRLAALAVKNDWAGLVIHGAIRDAALIDEMMIGVQALGTCPRKSVKKDRGQQDVELGFLGVRFIPGHILYCDRDGIVVSEGVLGD